MHQIGRRYYLSIGSWILDFQVSHIAKSGKHKKDQPNYFVEVAVRNHIDSIRDADLELCLLDQAFIPLRNLTRQCGNMELLCVEWAGSNSYFKANTFASESGPPEYLTVTLFGQSELVQLAFNGEQQSLAQADEKDGVEKGPGKEEQFDGGGKRRAPPPPPRTCCPATLTTPNGAQPSTIFRGRNAAGVVVSIAVECRPWVAQATFNAQPPPCDCTCCEYHQQIKGVFTVTPAGGGPAQDISPVTDYVQPPGPGPGQPIQVKGVNANNFVEDTIGDANNPGNPLSFGDRNDIQPRPGMFSYISQDYPTPCSYWGFDAPKAIRMAPGTTLNVDLTFRACIIDTCNQNNVVMGPNDWTWTFNGVVR